MQNISDLFPVTPSIGTNVAELAFLLCALAAFIKALVSRIDRVIDRSRFIHENDSSKPFLRAELPHLKLRAAFLNRSLFHGILAAILTALVIITAFISAMFRVPHEYGMATLFAAALLMFCASLVDLARETRIALHDDDSRM
jgi:hypothetical protein